MSDGLDISENDSRPAVLRAPSLEEMDNHAYGHTRAYAAFDSFKGASGQGASGQGASVDSGSATPRFSDTPEEE